jgi:secondary thiamine-phosphate synthase enzyme
MYRAEQLSVATRGRGFYALDEEVARVVARSGIRDGLCTVFVHHTSASVILCENADPAVQRDLEAWFARLVRDGDALFAHDTEGPDDMAAHVRTVLTQSSLSLPVRGGQLDLGTWQGLYLWEHRTHPHQRRVSVSVVG